MIWDIGLGLGCFHLLRLGYVLNNEIFLGKHPAILDTLDCHHIHYPVWYSWPQRWKNTFRRGSVCESTGLSGRSGTFFLDCSYLEQDKKHIFILQRPRIEN